MDRLTALWERLAAMDPRILDGALAVALTILTQVQVADAGPAGRAALLLTLAVAFRRVAPLAVTVVATVAVALQGLADDPPSVLGEYLAVTLVAYSVAAHAELPRAALGMAALAAGIVLHDLRSPEYGSLEGMVSDLVTPALAWGVGRAVRTARARAAQARAQVDETAAEAVASERRHIARELHDVVTHSLGIVVLQSQAARRFLDGREPEVGAALDAVEGAGRTAMDEMRRLLGLLREDGERASRQPQPSLADLPDLARRVEAAGLRVRLAVEGGGRLPAGVELSTYRIVQEALTNSLRHARAREARVCVRRSAGGVAVEVVDDGAGGTAGGDGGGLLGMRERVAVFGGTLEHGPRADGGYRVAAWLPVPPEAGP